MILFCLDDEKMWRDLIEDTAKHLGFSDYALFSDAPTFLNYIESLTDDKKRLVGVVVIDHILNSSFSGLDVLREVKKTLPICKPIVMTASEDGRVIGQYLNYDAWRWVQKDADTALENLAIYLKEGLSLAKKEKARQDVIDNLKRGIR